MTTNQANQAAASIDTPEFQALMKELIASVISHQIDVSREVMGRIISHINARLSESERSAAEAYKACLTVDQRCRQVEFERDCLYRRVATEEARAVAAESRLAALRHDMEELTPLGLLQDDRGICEIAHVDDGEYLDRTSVLELFEAQEFEPEPTLKGGGARTTVTVTTYELACGENGAPIREVQPAPAEGSFTREEARAAVISVMDSKDPPG